MPPQGFKGVKLAHGFLKDIDDNIVHIHQDPLPGGIPFCAQKFVVFLTAHQAYAVSKTLGVTHRTGAGNDQGIGKTALPFKINADHTQGLVLFKPLNQIRRLAACGDV